jgi:hypothetical protein
MPSKKQTPTPASLPKKKSQKESPATPKKETAGNIMVPPSPQKQESKAPSDRGNVFDKKKMIAIRDFLDAAEKSMASARKLIASLAPSGALRHELDINTSSLASYDDGEEKIIEGVFT